MTPAELAARGIKTPMDLQVFIRALSLATSGRRVSANGAGATVPAEARRVVDRMLDARPKSDEWEQLSRELRRLFAEPSPDAAGDGQRGAGTFAPADVVPAEPKRKAKKSP